MVTVSSGSDRKLLRNSANCIYSHILPLHYFLWSIYIKFCTGNETKVTEKRLWIGSNGSYAHFLSFDHFFMHGGDSYVGDLMIMTIFIYWWQKSMLVTFFACWWHSNRSPTSPIRQNVMLVTEIWCWCQTLDSDNVTCHLHPFFKKGHNRFSGN